METRSIIDCMLIFKISTEMNVKLVMGIIGPAHVIIGLAYQRHRTGKDLSKDRDMVAYYK